METNISETRLAEEVGVGVVEIGSQLLFAQLAI